MSSACASKENRRVRDSEECFGAALAQPAAEEVAQDEAVAGLEHDAPVRLEARQVARRQEPEGHSGRQTPSTNGSKPAPARTCPRLSKKRIVGAAGRASGGRTCRPAN